MSSLRHPIEAIHDRWGKAGLIVAVIALVAAMGGAAFAAKGALTGQQKKEVAKIAKKFAGKPGLQGPQGLLGLPGTAGKNGADGINGTNGTNGASGNSVLVGTPTTTECKEGGVTVEVQGSGSKTKICNGTKGAKGAEGNSVIGKTFLGSGEPLGSPCHGNGGAEFEVESTSTTEYVCNGEPGPVTEVAPSDLTMRGLFSYSNFVNEELRLQEMTVSFPFRVENASGEGPSFHYVGYMGSEEAEGYGDNGALIIGPAAGTGTVYGPVAATGDVTSGSKDVTSVNMTSGKFVVGQKIEGEGIPASTTVAAVGAGTLELSSAATETKSSDTLTGPASDQVGVNVTSGEFVSGTGWAASPPVPIGQEIEAEGIPSGTIVTKVEAGPNAGEVVLTLSMEPTESKAEDGLTGKASKVITLQVGGFGAGHHPTRGEIVTGPGIAAGTTIERVVRGEGYPRHEQFEISQEPTASATAATISVSEPAGCKGSLKHPGAEPGNFCLFLAEDEEGTVYGNLLNEGAGAEEVTSSGFFDRLREGLHAAGETFTPAPVRPLGAEFHGVSWFTLTSFTHQQTFPALEPNYFSMSEAEKEILKNEGKFEGTVALKGTWAVTAP